MTQETLHIPQVVHFVGIGGVGMSGLARIAVQVGMRVSGSDMQESHYMMGLAESGVVVSIGHNAQNIPDDCDVVVASTAISQENPELQYAKEQGIPIWHRSQMLAALGAHKKVVAAAGTHGKTTTSSMLATVFDALLYEPTFVVGGMVEPYGVNAHPGSGNFYIVEADESDGSFLNLNPFIALVTNIEADHLDHYEGGMQEIYDTFAHFMNKVPNDGALVVCAQDANLVDLARATATSRVLTYGDIEQADVRISNYTTSRIQSYFDVSFPNGETHHVTLRINPGFHNALNAAGVLTVMYALGAPLDKAVQALGNFGGVHRRFDTIGQACGVTIVDDYAHHPTEIEATIQAALGAGFANVHVVFQPHRYTRTQQFMDEFAQALASADYVYILDVFSAGEAPIDGVNAHALVGHIVQRNASKVVYVQDFGDAAEKVCEQVASEDVVITMGAGSVTRLAPQILSALQAGCE